MAPPSIFLRPNVAFQRRAACSASAARAGYESSFQVTVVQTINCLEIFKVLAQARDVACAFDTRQFKLCFEHCDLLPHHDVLDLLQVFGDCIMGFPNKRGIEVLSVSRTQLCCQIVSEIEESILGGGE